MYLLPLLLYFQEPPPIHHSFPREFYCNDVLQMKETNNEYLRDDSFFTIDRLKFSLSQPQGEKLPGAVVVLILFLISLKDPSASRAKTCWNLHFFCSLFFSLLSI